MLRGARDAALGGRERTIAGLSDLFQAEPFDVTQHPRKALAPRNPAQHSVDASELGARFGRSPRFGEGLEQAIVLGALEAEPAHQLALPEPAMRLVNRDLQEPGSHPRRLAEFAHVAQGLDE